MFMVRVGQRLGGRTPGREQRVRVRPGILLSVLMRRRWLAAAGLALAVVAVPVAVSAAGTAVTATCTPSPTITSGNSSNSFSVTCSYPQPAPVTSTITVAAPQQTVTVTATPPATTSSAPAVAQAKNCAPNPAACGFPAITNTGTTGGLTSAPCPSNVPDNTVVENESFTDCSISIIGRGVIVRNIKLTSSNQTGAAITVQPGASAAFSNVDIGGVSASQPVQYAILVSSHATGLARVTIDRAHIHDCIDCISADNTDITNSYFHAMRHPSGAHVDPIQCGGGDGCGLLVRHNTVFNEFSSTSAVAFFADFGPPTNSTLDNNLIAGGGYVVTGGNGVAGSRYSGRSSGIVISNNRFAKILYPYNASADCTDPTLHGCYGDITEWSASRPGNSATGNVDDATGNPITLN